MGLKSFRKQLDKIDHKIVKLLGKRMEVARHVGNFKYDRNMKIYQPSREAELRERLEALAKENGVRPKFLIDLWNDVMSESIREQEQVFEHREKK